METASFVVFVLAAATWVGAVAATAVFGARVRAREDADAVVAFAARHARIARWVAIPAALVALAAGLVAVDQRDLSIADDWWIGTGLGAWCVAFLGSTASRGKLLRRAVKLAAAQGAQDEDVRWRIRQVTLVVRGELLLVVVALVVVATTPSPTYWF